MFFFFFVRRVFAIIRSPFALGWWHQDGGIRVGWWRWCGGCDGKGQDARAFFCCAVDGLPAAPARRGAGHEARRPRGSRRGSWRVSLVRACSFVSAGIPFARLSICSRRRPHSSYSSTPVHTRPHPSHTRPHSSTLVRTRPILVPCPAAMARAAGADQQEYSRSAHRYGHMSRRKGRTGLGRECRQFSDSLPPSARPDGSSCVPVMAPRGTQCCGSARSQNVQGGSRRHGARLALAHISPPCSPSIAVAEAVRGYSNTVTTCGGAKGGIGAITGRHPTQRHANESEGGRSDVARAVRGRYVQYRAYMEWVRDSATDTILSCGIHVHPRCPASIPDQPKTVKIQRMSIYSTNN